jgi:hypothetical protein
MTIFDDDKSFIIEYPGPYQIRTTGPPFSITTITLPVLNIDSGQDIPKPQSPGKSGTPSSPPPGTGQADDAPDKAGD